MEFRTEVRKANGTLAEIATIIYQGQEFTSGGASVTETRATVYISGSGRKGDVTTFGGDVIGTYVETGKWKRRHPISGAPWTIRTVRVTLTDGRTYVGRYGPNSGNVVHLRRAKGELTNA